MRTKATEVRSALELKALPLRGKRIDLEPYSEALRPALQKALDCDAEAWNLFGTSAQGEHFASWWTRMTEAMRLGTGISYVMCDKSDGSVVGTTNFLHIRPERQTVEIGGTFLIPRARSGYVNPESKFLLLEYAFSSGARRVELLTDVRNVRSQAAIAKLGAVREGVMRRDRVTWTGHVRDTVLYSVTDLDWPIVRARLNERLRAEAAGSSPPPHDPGDIAE